MSLIKGIEYETAEEANMRLSNSVVLYDGRPVYISEIRRDEELPKGEICRVIMHELPLTDNNRGERKYISSGKFNLAPFKMGFLNLAGKTFYLSRNTARQNRQGLSERTLSVEALTASAQGSRLPRFRDLLNNTEFVDMITGKYPSVDEALTLLEQDDIASVAISREYAIVADEELEDLIVLFHKTKKVGFMPTKGSFKLSKKFKFLKEELDERKIKVEVS
jgi:hypothetical protein